MKTKLIIFPQPSELDDSLSQVRQNIVQNLSTIMGAQGEVVELDKINKTTIEDYFADTDSVQHIEVVFMLEEVVEGITPLPKLYVFAWPFSELPSSNRQQESIYSFFGPDDIGVICLSTLAKETIQVVVPSGLEVLSMPGIGCKILNFEQPADKQSIQKPPRILTDISNRLDGIIVDSADFDPNQETHKLGKYGDIHPRYGIVQLPWNGEAFSIPCNDQGFGPKYMTGFYETERWGNLVNVFGSSYQSSLYHTRKGECKNWGSWLREKY